MAGALDNWKPRLLDKPDYYDTVKFIYKYIDFHISEDEAYTILNVFIEKWDSLAGELVSDRDIVQSVSTRLRAEFDMALSGQKVNRVTELILLYLRETGHYCQPELVAR